MRALTLDHAGQADPFAGARTPAAVARAGLPWYQVMPGQQVCAAACICAVDHMQARCCHQTPLAGGCAAVCAATNSAVTRAQHGRACAPGEWSPASRAQAHSWARKLPPAARQALCMQVTADGCSKMAGELLAAVGDTLLSSWQGEEWRARR